MAGRSNLAYQAVPQERSQQKTTIKRVQSRQVEMIRPAAFISILLAVTALLGTLIFSMVQLNEVTSEVGDLQQTLREQQSEEVRLSTALESEMSLTNIESYAEQNLGLSELSSNQISYITIDPGNKIEVAGQEQNPDTSWQNTFTEDISDFFAYLFQ